MRQHLRNAAAWIRTHPVRSGLAALTLAALTVYAVATIRAVGFVQWLGVKDKPIWNVLELAIIPLVPSRGRILVQP